MSFRKILLLLSILLAGLIIANFQLVEYGISQAKGQLKVVWGARPNETWLNDPAFPDSLKRKILLVEEVKEFAFDSLGINFTENYSSMYDQQGQPLMFVVSACPPFQLEPVEFRFPLVGEFTYKGFFNEDMAKELAAGLKAQGYDTNIRTAGGWSTLGWFEDPILSDMLNRSSGYLVETIIHELTHGTLFVKDSLKFNENLATFIGTYGARRFLKNKFGVGSKEYKDYVNHWKDRRIYLHHMLRGAKHLDALYRSFPENIDQHKKKQLKEVAIKDIIISLDTLELNNITKYQKFLSQQEINNTFFMSYIRYHGEIEALEKELREIYNGNIKRMLKDYEAKYPSL